MIEWLLTRGTQIALLVGVLCIVGYGVRIVVSDMRAGRGPLGDR